MSKVKDRLTRPQRQSFSHFCFFMLGLSERDVDRLLLKPVADEEAQWAMMQWLLWRYIITPDDAEAEA
jgi:hypothetical protein